MLRLIGIVLSIGLADSLNPTTIAPALYLAAGKRPRARVMEFTIAVFVVYLVGGIAIALGPGQLLLSLIPHPKPRVTHLIEVGAGVAMLMAAGFLWRHRARLGDREPPDVHASGRSSWLLGATITAVELPTAFPYFAAIAAIVGSGVGAVRQLILLVLFNLCFVLPLLGIVLTLTLAGDQAQPILTAGRRFLQRHWPVLLAVIGFLAGAFVIVLGATGIAASSHGRLGRVVRHLRHTLHP